MENAQLFIETGQQVEFARRPKPACVRVAIEVLVMTVTLANPILQQMREELRVSEEFLARYNRPGPALYELSDGAGVERCVWSGRSGTSARRSRIGRRRRFRCTCIFPSARACACSARATSSFRKISGVAPPYLGVLKRELERVSRSVSRERPVVQFHWGGGTPTYLTPEQIEDLFGAARERFTFAPDAEIGIEVDPRVTSRAHLETLRRLGFNRLSMGIQDFHPDVQKAIQSHSAVRNDARPDFGGARAGIRQHQRGFDLRAAAPDAGALWAHRRTDLGAGAGSRRAVQLRARAVAEEAARRVCRIPCRKACRSSRFSAPAC